MIFISAALNMVFYLFYYMNDAILNELKIDQNLRPKQRREKGNTAYAKQPSQAVPWSRV